MLRPSPFGHRQPAMPTAKSVTIARIASPFSINKKYQTISFNALKSYFAATKRVVKTNDVIALSLYTGSSLIVHESDNGESQDERCAFRLDKPCLPLVTISSETAVNEIVYFLITNVEHSVIPSTLTNGEQDLYTGSTVGELGCWVDFSITRMIQTGLEHARVPELGSYLEPGMYSFVILCSAMIILQTFSIVDRHFISSNDSLPLASCAPRLLSRGFEL